MALTTLGNTALGAGAVTAAQIKSSVWGSDASKTTALFIKEGVAAATDVVAEGQLWVKNDAPNTLYFTDDLGNDTQLGVGSAPTGAGGDKIFYENGRNVTTDYTITDGQNAMSAGPITIDSGVTVTIGTDEIWTVV